MGRKKSVCPCILSDRVLGYLEIYHSCFLVMSELQTEPCSRHFAIQVLHQVDELVPGEANIPYDDLLAVALLVYFGIKTLQVGDCTATGLVETGV